MTHYQLAPYVRLGFLEHQLHFGFGSIQHIIIDKHLQHALLDAAEWFQQPRQLEEVEDRLTEAGYSETIAAQCMKILGNRMLLPEGAYHKEDRYSRPLLYYGLSGADVDQVQRKISESHVAVIGCGGIGNQIAVTLATAGVRQFSLVDRDDVELSNLSRQFMFVEADCGRSKVNSLGNALRARRSDIIIHEIYDFADESNLNLLKGCDLLIVSGDHPQLLHDIGTFSMENLIPYVNVGYIEDIAVWGPFVIPGKTGCHLCQDHIANNSSVSDELTERCRQINQRYQAPSNGPINMLASSMASLDILKYLGGFGTIASANKRIGIWTHNLHIETQDYSRNPGCPACSHLEQAIACPTL